jgi:hypothetical protein
MQTTTGRSCEDCSAELLEGAQFCVACGGSVAAPTTCPKCAASLPSEAKFCPSCGGKVVGARPKVEAIAPKADASAAPIASTPAVAPPPPRPKTGSSIGSNVLLFVAFLLVLVVVIYEMNKDAEKTVSPFAGGPAPSMGGGAPPPPPPAADGAEVATGEPIKGSVKIAAALGAPPQGTMFVILRNAGMPNKGPPLAVKRVEAPSFPASFSLGPSDIMMQGMPFNGPFDIYVRLDADGDPMTKAPGDLASEKPKSGVMPGAKDVEIELDQRL